jgi:hypothetical protein
LLACTSAALSVSPYFFYFVCFTHAQLLLLLLPLAILRACLQEDPHDDYSHLLQDLSGGEGLQESTDLIWGSSDELAATHQAGSSSSDSALETESPIISKVRRSLRSVWNKQRLARGVHTAGVRSTLNSIHTEPLLGAWCSTYETCRTAALKDALLLTAAVDYAMWSKTYSLVYATPAGHQARSAE